jgi:small-conductance mechanosensitive channel
MENRLEISGRIWRVASIKLVLSGIFCITALVISSVHGGIRTGNFDHRLTAFIAVMFFVLFAITFLITLTRAIQKTIVYKRLGVGRAAALEFILRLFGYAVILFTALDHMGVPVGHILLGSAVLGIILGVAAQQALANFFASIVLIISHPFTVGEDITLMSGGLGGKYEGRVIDIGLTHTRLEEKDGNIIALPNSSLLTGATIRFSKKTATKE